MERTTGWRRLLIAAICDRPRSDRRPHSAGVYAKPGCVVIWLTSAAVREICALAWEATVEMLPFELLTRVAPRTGPALRRG